MSAAPRPRGRPSGLARLIRQLRPHRRAVVLASLCSVLNKLFDLAPPVLIGLAVDVVVRQNISWLASLGFSSVPSQLTLLAVVSFVIWSAESLFEYLYALLWRNLAQTVQHELRVEGYDHLQRLEMGFFEAGSSGQLMTILNDDINQLERFLDHGANEVLQLITTVVAIGTAMVVLSPTVAGVSFLPIPLILWGSLRYQRRLAPLYAEVRARASDLASQLSNNLGGMLTIKSYAAEPWELARMVLRPSTPRAMPRDAVCRTLPTDNRLPCQPPRSPRSGGAAGRASTAASRAPCPASPSASCPERSGSRRGHVLSCSQTPDTAAAPPVQASARRLQLMPRCRPPPLLWRPS